MGTAKVHNISDHLNRRNLEEPITGQQLKCGEGQVIGPVTNPSFSQSGETAQSRAKVIQLQIAKWLPSPRVKKTRNKSAA